MAKNIEWIKITTGMFEDEKIEFIETLPEGDSIFKIWVRLLCMAGKCNAGGYIFITEKIPYTEDALVAKFKKSLTVVRLALETLRQLDMIQTDENGFIAVTNWAKHQNVEGMEKIREQNRERQRRYVEKRRAWTGLPEGSFCAYCGGKADTIDHVNPLSTGGEDTLENKVPCCSDCNSRKSNLPLDVFLNYNASKVSKDIIFSNPKLSKYITFNNVSKRYEITQSSISYSSSDSSSLNSSEENSTSKEIQESIGAVIQKRPFIPTGNGSSLIDETIRHWNSKGLVRCVFTSLNLRSDDRTAFLNTLSAYGIDAVKQAIDNYATVISNPAVYNYEPKYQYRSVGGFMSKGVVSFSTDNNPLERYARNKKNTEIGSRKVPERTPEEMAAINAELDKKLEGLA